MKKTLKPFTFVGENLRKTVQEMIVKSGIKHHQTNICNTE